MIDIPNLHSHLLGKCLGLVGEFQTYGELWRTKEAQKVIYCNKNLRRSSPSDVTSGVGSRSLRLGVCLTSFGISLPDDDCADGIIGGSSIKGNRHTSV